MVIYRQTDNILEIALAHNLIQYRQLNRRRKMNKEYALELLEMVERRTLNPDSWLAREAFRYLRRLKRTSSEVLDRIYKQENKR